MPKQKKHKGMSKVFKERKNDYKTGTPNGRHNTGKKNAASNRKTRSGSKLSKSDYKRIKDLI